MNGIFTSGTTLFFQKHTVALYEFAERKACQMPFQYNWWKGKVKPVEFCVHGIFTFPQTQTINIFNTKYIG